MFICICKGVTDTQIRQAIANGATSVRDLRKELGLATQCCKCLPDAKDILSEPSLPDVQSGSLFYSA